MFSQEEQAKLERRMRVAMFEPGRQEEEMRGKQRESTPARPMVQKAVNSILPIMAYELTLECGHTKKTMDKPRIGEMHNCPVCSWELRRKTY